MKTKKERPHFYGTEGSFKAIRLDFMYTSPTHEEKIARRFADQRAANNLPRRLNACLEHQNVREKVNCVVFARRRVRVSFRRTIR
jgi:hypothetical protein